MSNIYTAAREYADFASAIYRDLHRRPEISHHEVETNKRIRRELDALGIPYLAPRENVTVALIAGRAPKRAGGLNVVGVRADTDALELQELTDLPFKSEIPGVMHGCGHDAHTAGGILCARLLSENADAFSGTAKVVFQPAEEGAFGARLVIDEGVLDDVQAFFGIHLWSQVKRGELYVSSGAVCASADMFTLRVLGSGGHGAYPELCVDVIPCASAIVAAFQTIPSRVLGPTQPSVVTVGSFHAGTRCNIIAGEAVLEGTFRTFSDGVREKLSATLRRMAEDVAAAYGCTAELTLHAATRAVINDEAMCGVMRRAAKDIGLGDALRPQAPNTLGDDFAEYRSIAPSCYALVGMGDEALGTHHAHHNGLFRVDEAQIPVFAAWLAQSAMDALNGAGE